MFIMFCLNTLISTLNGIQVEPKNEVLLTAISSESYKIKILCQSLYHGFSKVRCKDNFSRFQPQLSPAVSALQA